VAVASERPGVAPGGTVTSTSRSPAEASAGQAHTEGRRMGRSILAVAAGMLLIIVLSIGVDLILHAAGVLPALGEPTSDGLLLLATAYRTVITVGGGYLTARLAPRRPMRHALALGVVGLVLGTIGVVATWNAGPAFEQKWYPIALTVLAVPCSWVGGALHERRRGCART
jgi:hypothetical protein